MVNVQNEIKYSIAFSMLKKLLDDQLIDTNEFDIAHKFVIRKYGPAAVRQLP